jgi:cytidylate kinase
MTNRGIMTGPGDPADGSPDEGGAMARNAPRVVTISATYGAGGTVVAPQVADRLQLPYLERLVSPRVARQASVDDAAERRDEAARPEGVTRRLLGALAALPAVFGTGIPQPVAAIDDEEQVRTDIEAGIRTAAETTGGVLLGRGATIVLHEDPGVFHVRLDGPAERRIRQAMTVSGVDEAEARRRLHETDRARTAYLRRFYDVNPDDPHLYHLMLDSTAVPLATCTDVIVEAVSAFWAAAP